MMDFPGLVTYAFAYTPGCITLTAFACTYDITHEVGSAPAQAPAHFKSFAFAQAFVVIPFPAATSAAATGQHLSHGTAIPHGYISKIPYF